MPLAAVLAAVAVTAATPNCTHAQVRLHVGRGNGTAGTIFYPLTFTNQSAHACALRGFPGVASVTRRHHRVGSPATRDSVRPRTVRLRAHGGTATAVLGIVDTGALPRSSCRPVSVWGLQVFAPNQTRAFFAHLRHSACSRRGSPNMHVRPVVRGRTGL
jgi:uncharacterized protein DUF4232